MESAILECHSPVAIPSSSNTPLDQVSSLREAALSTLRAKRRKPGLEKASLSRPPPAESIQLDYGQEESYQPTTKPTLSGPLKTMTLSSAKQPEFAPEDVQMREEGEISEEEDIPPAPPAPKETPKSPVEVPSAKPIPPARRFSVASKDLSQSTAQSRRSLEPSPVSPQPIRRRSTTPGTHMSAAHLALLALDENHVRPGIEMTQQQYDTAKDIVLDLLGWGVPPEYLVECGLSREFVFYVFAELNLRLPRNLDTTGLVPYTPEAMSTAHQVVAATMQVEVPARVESTSPVKDMSHISKPAESSSSPADKSTISSRSLHDIEMQRRQELLARKRAVLASRKSKQSSTTNLVTTPPESTSAVSPDVDSFLKSISAIDAPATTPFLERGISLPKSDDAMDVDDIPGLGGLHATEWTISPSQEQSQSAKSSSCAIQSFTESSHFAVEKSDSVSSVGSSTSSKCDIMYGQARRGTKRPVASDFVDLDSNTRLPTTNGGYNHESAHFHSYTSRRGGAIDFGSVNNGHRRCVIDLSDSEEEFRGEGNARRRKQRSPFNTPGSSSTPPVNPTMPISPGMAKEPSVLEMEIQRMKELIAKKEQDRLRKLATRAQNPIDGPGDVANPKHVEVHHNSLRSKSPIIFDKRDDDGGSESNDNTNFPELYESSDASNVSVAAALSGPYMGASAGTTRVIGSVCGELVLNSLSGADDEAFVPMADRTNGDIQLMKAESAEDVVKQNVVDGQVWDSQGIQSIEDVDVDVDMSSSAEVVESARLKEQGFMKYQSPLELYPHLRTDYEFERQSNIISIDDNKARTEAVVLTDDSRSLERDTRFLDLKLLKLGTATRRLDPLKRICQYEIPGGGTCRDGRCEDIHLSQLVNSDDPSEPNDDDTAEYVYKKLPKGWLDDRDIKSPDRIKAALEEMRLQCRLKMAVEDRVKMALGVLKPPGLTDSNG